MQYKKYDEGVNRTEKEHVQTQHGEVLAKILSTRRVANFEETVLLVALKKM